jgi:hypothetical protein
LDLGGEEVGVRVFHDLRMDLEEGPVPEKVIDLTTAVTAKCHHRGDE